MESNQKDIQYWKQLKGGSTSALGCLYDMYIDELHLYGCKISSDVTIVEDCIHDLFFDLFKYRKNLADTSNVKFYLLSSLKNRIYKNPEFQKENIQETYQLNKNFVAESIEEEFIQQELFSEKSKKLANALQLLPKKQREGLLLKFLQNKSYEEIAEIMDIKVETSRTIVYRGIKSLREIFMLIISLFFNIW